MRKNSVTGNQRYRDTVLPAHSVTKRCEQCGKLCLGKVSTVKYCSDACRMKAYRRRHDPKLGSRERKQQRSQNTFKTKQWNRHCFNCEQCGRYIETSQHQALRFYCSDACKQKAYRQRKKEASK